MRRNNSQKNRHSAFFRISRHGFTVVEALVAISILLVSISGAFAVAQSSLQSSSLVKNRVTAYYLAQEGIEFVRHMRDNNGLETLYNGTSNVSWLHGIAESAVDPCYFGLTCIADATGVLSPSLQTCNDGCPSLRLNTQTGRLEYNVSDDIASGASFTRTIQVTSASDDNNEVLVTVVVSWDQNGVTQSLAVSENLYNWQEL